MGIPAGLTLHLETLHGLVAAERILNSTSNNMVNARHAVGRGRTLVEHKRRSAFAHLHALLKQVLVVPSLKHLTVYLREVELVVLVKFLAHTI